MRTNGHRRPEEIEADIERTRSELNDTLHALERRFSPGELIDQGLGYLRHSGAKEYAHNLGAAARRDPVPMALVGVGLAWLMMSSRRSPYDAPSVHPTTGEQHGLSASGVKQKVSATTQRVSDTAHAARERMSDTAHAARERMHHMGDSARQGARHLRERYDHIAQEQPLVLGALGLALGALLGASAPRSRTEDRWMGDTSDRLTERAKATARAAGDALKGDADGASHRTDMPYSSPASAASATATGSDRHYTSPELHHEERSGTRVYTVASPGGSSLTGAQPQQPQVPPPSTHH